MRDTVSIYNNIRTFALKENFALEWSLRQAQRPVTEPVEVTLSEISDI